MFSRCEFEVSKSVCSLFAVDINTYVQERASGNMIFVTSSNDVAKTRKHIGNQKKVKMTQKTVVEEQLGQKWKNGLEGERRVHYGFDEFCWSLQLMEPHPD